MHRIAPAFITLFSWAGLQWSRRRLTSVPGPV